MRKRALVLGIAMTVLLTGCNSPVKGNDKEPAEAAKQPVQSSSEENTEFGIGPMPERTTLRVGYFVGVQHALPIYVADQKGWFDELNIDLEYVTFSNGPAMMEASSSWDFSSTGGPGTIVGALAYGVKCIGTATYDAGLNLYVREDSPIYQSGKGHVDGYEEIYGTPEDWKGTTWLLPVGTTLHKILFSTLEKVGVDNDQVTIVNMDVSSALAGFKAGEGDGCGEWSTLALAAEHEGYKKVGGLDANGDIIVCNVCATSDAIGNKKDLITKAYELYYRSAEWCLANPEEAADYYMEVCSDEGVLCTKEDAAYAVSILFVPTLEESIAMFKNEMDDPRGTYTKRKLNQVETDLFETFDFFVDQDKYTQEDRNFLLDNRMVDSSIAEAVEQEIKNRK